MRSHLFGRPRRATLGPSGVFTSDLAPTPKALPPRALTNHAHASGPRASASRVLSACKTPLALAVPHARRPRSPFPLAARTGRAHKTRPEPRPRASSSVTSPPNARRTSGPLVHRPRRAPALGSLAQVETPATPRLPLPCPSSKPSPRRFPPPLAVARARAAFRIRALSRVQSPEALLHERTRGQPAPRGPPARAARSGVPPPRPACTQESNVEGALRALHLS